MQIIDGKKISKEIIESLKEKANLINNKKFLGAVLVGDDSSSLKFLKQKENVSKELGIDFRIYNFPQNITTDNLRQKINQIVHHKTCGGLIVQLPLPDHINTYYVLNAIPKQKDPDVLSEHSLGAFYTQRNKILPPSVNTVKEIFKRQNIEIEDLNKLNIAVIGFGFLIGKPISFWLLPQVNILRVFNKKSFDVKYLKDFDVIISGAGKANLFSAKDVKDNTLVIDFGYDFIDGKIKGDFNSLDVGNTNISYTPTPFGTGPILVAKLFQNFVILNN
jgi:methylenetetrahydrofolate dehydrogenase (NADP+)/methenyltetrahydrofolate cyclohydrolase